MVLSEYFFFFFFFFRRQGFRMITFDRQAGPLQNLNRSHVMAIGRSVSFSDPARPPGGGVGRPKRPKIPPPPRFLRFRTPGTFLKKKFSREKKLWNFWPPPKKFFFLGVLRPQEHFLAEIFFQLKIPPPPPPPARPRPVLRTLTPILVQ